LDKKQSKNRTVFIVFLTIVAAAAITAILLGGGSGGGQASMPGEGAPAPQSPSGELPDQPDAGMVATPEGQPDEIREGTEKWRNLIGYSYEAYFGTEDAPDMDEPIIQTYEFIDGENLSLRNYSAQTGTILVNVPCRYMFSDDMKKILFQEHDPAMDEVTSFPFEYVAEDVVIINSVRFARNKDRDITYGLHD
jgi:hypothetical protein